MQSNNFFIMIFFYAEEFVNAGHLTSVIIILTTVLLDSSRSNTHIHQQIGRTRPSFVGKIVCVFVYVQI